MVITKFLKSLSNSIVTISDPCASYETLRCVDTVCPRRICSHNFYGRSRNV